MLARDVPTALHLGNRGKFNLLELSPLFEIFFAHLSGIVTSLFKVGPIHGPIVLVLLL